MKRQAYRPEEFGESGGLQSLFSRVKAPGLETVKRCIFDTAPRGDPKTARKRPVVSMRLDCHNIIYAETKHANSQPHVRFRAFIRKFGRFNTNTSSVIGTSGSRSPKGRSTTSRVLSTLPIIRLTWQMTTANEVHDLK